MNDTALILSSLKSRWLNSVLSVFLTAFGVMLAVLIIQFGHHVQSRLSTDGQGVDIVIGAKGSPLQLVMSSVYHIDIPTGNIAYEDAQKWMRHPHVKTAIPLALGDNWRGYRIVGTTPAYMNHYSATLADGRVWNKAFEAVAGSATGLKMGDEFAGAHGLSDGGHNHDEEHYNITGVMKPTGTVLDRLILTPLDSVLEIHGLETVGHESHDHDNHAKKTHDNHSEHGHDDHKGHGHQDHEEDSHDDHGEKSHDDHKGHDHAEHAQEKHSDHAEHGHEEHGHEEHTENAHENHDHGTAGEPEITALLISTKSPISNINLPRSINRESALQAANPALEMARLTSMLGLGSQSFAALSMLLIIIAALSIFAGLAGSLDNRMGDLAVLRAIGYSKARLFKIITLEGMVIVTTGLALGVLMGVAGFTIMADFIAPLAASGAKIVFTSDFISVMLSVLLAGFLATTVPALRASRVATAQQLSRDA